MLLLCNTWVLAHNANCFLRLCFPQLRILYDHGMLLLLTTEYFLQSSVNLTGSVNLGSFITEVGVESEGLSLLCTRKWFKHLILQKWARNIKYNYPDPIYFLMRSSKPCTVCLDSTKSCLEINKKNVIRGQL